MLKIVFYTETVWAFGVLHNSLCCILSKYEIDCIILNWGQSYKIEEIKMITDDIDFYVTTPSGVLMLVNVYKVPIEKIKIVVHGLIEIFDICIKHQMQKLIEECAGYGVVSEGLKQLSANSQMGLTRVPVVLPIKIEVDRFYMPHAQSLKKVGYAGSQANYTFFGKNCKRPYLANECCSFCNLPLTSCKTYHYLTMPTFYKSVDCVMITSDENETVGLPFMEAAAAGRLVIGAEVGCNIAHKNSIVMPLAEAGYKEKACEVLLKYKKDSVAFGKKCKEIQDYAMEHFSWKGSEYSWVSFLSK